MSPRVMQAKAWFLFIVAALGLTLGCNLLAPSGSPRSEDAAVLLMLASHSLIEASVAQAPSASRAPGLSGALAAGQIASGPRRNEARIMAEWYHALAEKLPEDDEVRQGYLDKADDYYDQAKAVDEERERAERRRHRGFFRWFSRQVKNVGEGLGRVVGGVMGFAGAVMEYVIEEELPARIRAAIKGEWERIKGIAQGRIEMFWQRLASRYGDVSTSYLRDRIDPLFIRLRDRVTGRARRVSRRLTLTAQALNPAEAKATPTQEPVAPPTLTQPPTPGQVLTKTGTVVPIGLNPGLRATSNKITITFQDDGRGVVRGRGVYAAFYMWEECRKELPTSTRWELTGTYDPAAKRFSGTMQEYGQGQIAYTNCSVGDVPEYTRGQEGTWEAALENGIIKGSMTLIQGGGTPILRVTFEAR